MTGWWRRQTLRSRLALWYALGGAALFSAFGGGIYYFVASRMARPLEHRLRQDEATIRANLVVNRDRGLLWRGTPVDERTNWNPQDPWFELWDEKGVLVARFWALDETTLNNLPTAPTPNRDTISIFRVSGDVRLRVLSVPYRMPGYEKPWMLRVIRLHRRTADSLGTLFAIIACSLPVIVFLLVFGGYRLTLHWLRPLESLVEATARIKADNFAFRLPVANPHDEIGQLATAFNKTLDRLEGSYSALDRFVADASHELRTPLSALRTVGEVALSAERSATAYRDIVGSMLEEAQRLQRLVERLLELARAEGGGQLVTTTRMKADFLVQECVAEMRLLAEEKSQRLTVTVLEDEVQCDPSLLRQSLRNLIENAVKYCPDGAQIEVRMTRCADATLEISVADDGPGIAPEHRARVMDRFFRADASRKHERAGFGLGLAITRAYMRAMGGDVEFRPASPHGSVFALRLKR